MNKPTNSLKHDCNICSHPIEEKVLTIFNPDRFELAAGIVKGECERAWFKCAHCSALSNIRLDNNNAKLKKIESSYYNIDFGGIDLMERFNKIQNLPRDKSDNKARVERIVEFFNNWTAQHSKLNFNLLDIGAGLGVFADEFIKRQLNSNWSLTLIEPDLMAVDHLRKLSLNRVNIFDGRFENFPDKQKFDLCTLNKVLEHIEFPLSFLKGIQRFLDPNFGILYVEVPDSETVNYRKAEDNILGSLHHHLYDVESLGHVLTRAGYIPLLIQRVVENSGKLSIISFSTVRASFVRMASTE
ncbi:class I SAM-dependent methyltransferase [Polynucleobacter sp. AP-Elch-400A-B2]|uniref:class I SAM-dependent methyltransferase n=1 Tax=Polynucleobacter sp. AP-Elch-400A-B2 TaxID=2576930 RepID=UPI001BFDC705|nr:class I SAM-dependent methyltransferase [Polynucleobacter sp. AP-Elch-400A-B2]QWE24991.1 class I SAM-dependent methyltransferase [Polynucleobacter sp. AP-Elch-400A-B2]